MITEILYKHFWTFQHLQQHEYCVQQKAHMIKLTVYKESLRHNDHMHITHFDLPGQGEHAHVQ